VNDPSPTPTLDEFLACCQAACEFLVRDFGFQQLPSPREYNDYSMRFRKGEIGVDIYGENWGQNASCDLVRGDAQLGLGLLIPASQRAAPRRGRKHPGQLEQIQALATFLKLHAGDFLSGDTRRFDAAHAEWVRITRPRVVTEAHRAERRRQQDLTAAGHASKRGDHTEVIRLLEPHAGSLSSHQRRLLETARQNLGRAR